MESMIDLSDPYTLSLSGMSYFSNECKLDLAFDSWKHECSEGMLMFFKLQIWLVGVREIPIIKEKKNSERRKTKNIVLE
jgi:hypothetical protein